MEVNVSDPFIVVMGPTGAGKTSFINLCLDADILEIGHDLYSSRSLLCA